MQKNGGNVASYFLTPEGLVIDAVVGPVSATNLLEEAHWAVDTYQKARLASPNDVYGQQIIVGQAHQALANDRVHKLLAEAPLVPLQVIQQRVFEKLADQKVSQNRSHVQLAAMEIEHGQRLGKPILFVLVKAGTSPGNWDEPTAALLEKLSKRPIAAAMRQCTLVTLPIDELPALSNLVKLPDFDLAERSTPTMVLTASDGTQLAKIAGASDPKQIAEQLSEAVNRARLVRADKLLAEGKRREAESQLKLIKLSSAPVTLKDEAARRLADLRSPQTALGAANTIK